MRTTADSSVVVAGLATWHTEHAAALPALEAMDSAVPHTLAEAFAVLTGMPPPFRSPTDQVQRALRDLRSRCTVLEQPSEFYDRAMSAVNRAGRAGGAIYDALVAVTAAEAGATLATLDERAQAVYLASGVRFELIG